MKGIRTQFCVIVVAVALLLRQDMYVMGVVDEVPNVWQGTTIVPETVVAVPAQGAAAISGSRVPGSPEEPGMPVLGEASRWREQGAPAASGEAFERWMDDNARLNPEVRRQVQEDLARDEADLQRTNHVLQQVRDGKWGGRNEAIKAARALLGDEDPLRLWSGLGYVVQGVQMRKLRSPLERKVQALTDRINRQNLRLQEVSGYDARRLLGVPDGDISPYTLHDIYRREEAYFGSGHCRRFATYYTEDLNETERAYFCALMLGVVREAYANLHEELVAMEADRATVVSAEEQARRVLVEEIERLVAEEQARRGALSTEEARERGAIERQTAEQLRARAEQSVAGPAQLRGQPITAEQRGSLAGLAARLPDESGNEAGLDECPICLGDLDSNVLYRFWLDGWPPHEFHLRCLSDYLSRPGNDACPVCRRPVDAAKVQRLIDQGMQLLQ